MNFKKIFISFLIFILIQGCSIPTDFYIQNLTDEIKTIKIKFNVSLIKYSKIESNEMLNFNYKNDILNPVEFSRNEDGELKILEKLLISDSIIQINIYPKSTTRIIKTSNYRWLNWLIENIEIDNEKIDIKEIAFNSEQLKNDYLYVIE